MWVVAVKPCKKAVSAYFKSKLIRPFDFAERRILTLIQCCAIDTVFQDDVIGRRNNH